MSREIVCGQRAEVVRNTPELRDLLVRTMMQRGLDLRTLTRLAGYDQPRTLYRLLALAELDFYPAMLSAIAGALELPLDRLPVAPAERAALAEVARGWQTRDVPVLTLAHAARGEWVPGAADIPETFGACDDRIPVPTNGRRYFGFRVEGDSMAPQFRHGDIALADMHSPPAQHRPCVVRLADQMLIKRWTTDGARVRLTSDNPRAGHDFDVPLAEIAWAKLVTGLYRPVR